MSLTLLLGACTGGEADPEQTRAPSGPDAAAESPDPALASACTEFWGDPDYSASLSRVVLDRAATAPEAGESDPAFYAMTGDDIERTFEQAPEDARSAGTGLADWFRTQPERGADADLDAFEAAWNGLAGSCAGVSAAAAWTLEPGADGTKPAALVCADVFDTPGTLTHFANANVLTSNMFKLVGLSPRRVPADRTEDVQATADLLAQEIAWVDDDAVSASLQEVRAPFQDALDGDTWSEGLRDPLTSLGSACDAAGYPTPGPGEMGEDDQGSDQGEEGLV